MKSDRIRQMLRTGAGTLLVTVLAAGAHCAADAATLCKKPSGVLAARDTCKRKEQPMPASLFQGDAGAQGPAGQEGPQGPGGPSGPAGAAAGPRVVDSNGKSVGVLDDYGRVMTTIPTYGRAIVSLGPDHVKDTYPRLDYTSPNCVGTPLIRAATNTFVPSARVNGTDLWLPGTAVSLGAALQSFEYITSSCIAPDFVDSHGLCCRNLSFTADETTGVHFDVSIVGTPPFSLQP